VNDAPPVGDEPEFRGGRQWKQGLPRGDFQQRRAERRRRLERARMMADRLLAHPNAPVEVKAKARRLAELLNKRESIEQRLESKRQAFLREHQAEIDELRQLHDRAERLRNTLRDAREKAMADNLSDIQEMRRVTEEARETAQQLRQQFQGPRRRERDWLGE
jgi:hypothetical protein